MNKKIKLALIIILANISFIGVFAQPANDLCTTAQSIIPDSTCVNGTTVGAADNLTSTAGCQAGAPNSHEDVWYTFVSTGTQLTGVISETGAWTGDIEVLLMTGTCGGLT